ncbi:MAG: DUF3821 domain-containing protein [Methanoregula sp.]|jgi:hypothetical protein
MIPRRSAFIILFVFLLVIVPASASLSNVVSGAPIFIGEQNLDISACLNGHTVIAWWPAGSDRTGDPTKTVTIDKNATSYYLDPAIFSGYAGRWYTHDTKPDVLAFVLYEPTLNLTVIDTDTNQDVTGQTLPMSANITYRIDTNQYMALDYSTRPNYNPSDSFFTVTLTSPSGTKIPQIFTGDVGASTTQIIQLDTHPLIKSPTYTWQNGAAWDRNAIGPEGSAYYQTGTYRFKVTSNLNGMQGSYSSDAAIGKDSSGEQPITFVADAMPTTLTTAPTVTASSTMADVSTPVQETTTAPVGTVSRTSTVTQARTTFTPVPTGIAVLGVLLGGILLAFARKH